MQRREARKAWAMAVAASLAVHALLVMVLVRDWNSHPSPPPERLVEITLARSRPPAPIPGAATPITQESRAAAGAPTPPMAPGAATAPSVSVATGDPPRANTEAGTPASRELGVLAFPPVRGCADEPVERMITDRRPDCDPQPMIAMDQLPPRRLSTTEPGYPPPSTPEWERAAATQKAWRAYRECGNFFSCGDLNKCGQQGKSRAAGCDTYPGLRSLVGRIFGD